MGLNPVYVISFGQKIIPVSIVMVYISLKVAIRRLHLCAYLDMEKSKLLGKSNRHKSQESSWESCVVCIAFRAS